MAVSHKDWELANSRIWLAEIDIERGLDIFIKTGDSFAVSFLLTTVILKKCQKAWWEKDIKEDQQTLAELSSAYRRSQANVRYYKPVPLNELNCSCPLVPYNKHFINWA